jgi:hypothetical protein
VYLEGEVLEGGHLLGDEVVLVGVVGLDALEQNVVEQRENHLTGHRFLRPSTIPQIRKLSTNNNRSIKNK